MRPDTDTDTNIESREWSRIEKYSSSSVGRLRSRIEKYSSISVAWGTQTRTYTKIELAIKIERRTAVCPDTQIHNPDT